MRRDVADDMRLSSQALREIVLPYLKKHCPEFGGMRVEIIENPHGTDRLRVHLDTLAGIDAYQYWDRGIRGIAARVQQGNFRTFTVRENRPSGAKTELEKRLFALHNKNKGCITSYWTLQAYMTKGYGRLLSVGLAKTEEFYRYIEQRETSGHPFKRKNASDGGEQFFYVSWDQYQRYAHQAGYYFFENAPTASVLQARDETLTTLRQSYGDPLNSEIDKVKEYLLQEQNNLHDLA
jgi:hypothetical protein